MCARELHFPTPKSVRVDLTALSPDRDIVRAPETDASQDVGASSAGIDISEGLRGSHANPIFATH